jgi:hypothetical protein
LKIVASPWHWVRPLVFLLEYSVTGKNKRPNDAPEMSFLKHKDAYQFPGGIYQSAGE